MLVIHGIWAYGALSLWAENSDGPATAQPRPRHPSRAPRPHPFASALDVLADVVAELAGPAADLARKAIEDELTLRLPGTPDGPVASPALIREPGAEPVKSAARPALSAWRVPALTFEPDTALDLLAALGNPGARSSRAVAGGSVVYLAAVARLAGDLAARGRVLPALVAGADGPGGQDTSYAARWRPVLSGADAQRARDLAAAMPPLCRATDAEGEPSARVLTDALDVLADVAARARLDADRGFGLVAVRRGRRPARVPVAERWAAALTGTDAQVSVATPEDEAEAAELAASLEAWRGAAQVPVGPVRTCFRLIEPREERSAEEAAGAGEEAAGAGGKAARAGGDWTVEFALQSTDDPSLLLPATDVWSGATAGGWAAAGIRHPEEDLLAGLGTASRLFPELDRGLRAAAPAEVTLDTEGALRFLKETGPLLSGAGFGVLLPDWVSGARRSRLGLRMTTRTRSTAGASATESKFGMGDLVDFRYDLAIGDQALDPEELEELARLKVPLVRLRGRWVELDDRHLQAALKFLERNRAGTMTAADALAAGLHGPDLLGAVDGVPVTEVDADGWLGDLLSGQADRRLAPVATPASFRGELRPYQERGLAWLSFLGNLGLGGVLADSMGLGKTPQTLALIAKGTDRAVAPTLLVCPMSLVGNWEREAARFTPDLAVHVHHGADRLACDEAQNIKNAATRQARAVRALPARARIALTGTPVENRLTDLWSIMEFTSPGLLGPAETFRKRFAVPIERNGDEEAAERLKRITGPFILRRLKTDKAIISDLPDKLEMKVWCNLTPEQASLYQATVTDMLARIEAADEGIERRGLVLSTMAKLKQVLHPVRGVRPDAAALPGRPARLPRALPARRHAEETA